MEFRDQSTQNVLTTDECLSKVIEGLYPGEYRAYFTCKKTRKVEYTIKHGNTQLISNYIKLEVEPNVAWTVSENA